MSPVFSSFIRTYKKCLAYPQDCSRRFYREEHGMAGGEQGEISNHRQPRAMLGEAGTYAGIVLNVTPLPRLLAPRRPAPGTNTRRTHRLPCLQMIVRLEMRSIIRSMSAGRVPRKERKKSHMFFSLNSRSFTHQRLIIVGKRNRFSSSVCLHLLTTNS